MDDLAYGKRNKRGDWTPSAYLTIAPVFVLPPRPLAFLKWLPRLFPALESAVRARPRWPMRFSCCPDVEVMKTLAWGWILRLFIVNCVAVFLFYSAFEYRLYMSRAQGNRFKYHAKFPNDQKNNAFLFGSQNLESIIRAFRHRRADLDGDTRSGSSSPSPTATRRGSPSPSIPSISVCWRCSCRSFHEFHFFCIHRLIHWPPLYRWVHSSTTTRSIRRPGRRCRCIRSSSSSISRRPLGM